MSRNPVRTVVITGASAGIGRATAIAFAERGWNVGLIARGQDGLDGAARDVRRAGGRAVTIAADVADAAALELAADRVAEAFGGIDVWVNNAMATIFAPVAAISPEEFRRVTAVTYLGQVHGTLAALKHMRASDRGTIVQVGSALSYRAIPLQSAYCAAKFAVRGFTDALRSELLHDRSRIRLTMVQLPAVNTPQFEWARSRLPGRIGPVPPIFQPEAIAEEIVRAAAEAPREVWIGRSSVQAIVATAVAPGLVDRILASTGYSGQMSDEPADRTRPDNLFEPVPTRYGTHGRFDDQAESSVAAFDPAWLRAASVAAGFALAAGATLLARRLTIRSRRLPPR